MSGGVNVRRLLQLGAIVLAASSENVSTATVPRPPSAFFEDFKRLDERRWYVSDGWANGDWQNCSWSRRNLKLRDGILQLSLTRSPNPVRQYRCAEIRTHAVLGYGTFEARVRLARGSGLNTAMFTYSGRPLTGIHDEIDFEGLGRNPASVQINHWRAGKPASVVNAAVGADGSATFHDYAFEWSPNRIRWFIDGRLVHQATRDIPSTPGQLIFSLWSSGKSKQDWLGAFTAPLPATAEIDWVGWTPNGQRCRFPQSVTCRFPQ